MDRDATLREVEQRVLWLATSIVHHANRVRPNPDGLKVGGHQASSASLVSIMTELWFNHLRPEDRVSVKPHASPVLHAINYLLGELSAPHLETLRAFGGLQSYPSRAKDPDTVDYSTGSVGIGATAPIWGALARRYVARRAPGASTRSSATPSWTRAPCWEAILDPMVQDLGEVVLDRRPQPAVPRPDRAQHRRRPPRGHVRRRGLAGAHRQVRAAAARAVRTPRRRRAAAADRRHGEPRVPAAAPLHPRPAAGTAARETTPSSPSSWPGSTTPPCTPRSATSAATTCASLREAFDAIDDTRPTVIFAYTVKGYGLATEGHPQNHSSLLTAEQLGELAEQVGASTDAARGPASRRRRPPRRCAATPPSGCAARPSRRTPCPSCPPTSAAPPAGTPPPRPRSGAPCSTSPAPRPTPRSASSPLSAGRLVVDQPRRLGEQGRRVVGARARRLVRRRPRDHPALARTPRRPAPRAGHRRDQPGRPARRAGRHLEPLGPAAAADRGALRPVRRTRAGAVVVRHLRGRPVDPRRHAVRGDARPGGRRPPVDHHAVDRAGAARLHRPTSPRSPSTSSGRLLAALARLGRPGGRSAYLRLSTRPVDQTLAAIPTDPAARERRRRQVVAGGYPLRRADGGRPP